MSPRFRIGMQVLASDGGAGVVEDVLYKDGEPRFLVVRDQGVFGQDAVLPVRDATIEGTAARLTLTRSDVHKSDRYDESRYGAQAGYVSLAAQHYDQGEGK